MLEICGGYQMFGRIMADPDGIERPPGEVPGLGLPDITTVMAPEKRLARVAALNPPSGTDPDGYEIHLGRTIGPDTVRGWLRIDGRDVGAASPDGRIRGCYLHGLSASDAFRRADLSDLGVAPTDFAHETQVDATLDALADHMTESLNLDRLLDISTRLP
ncbi:Cobyric acid synthase [Jannaschia aquimarina]|uniref:CobQ protein n=1 Tax=Jannaschia aquimarina TaxID=935700 RepID=A0A0D1D8Q7_9RHOB|nr:Cobyric acid synthase [Jannaschia aquimarina]SNT14554.1 adenosylcobyric acid synthase [Jannaschia aquimarina]